MLPALIQRAREVMKRARDTADVIWYVGGATVGWFGSTSSPIRRITTTRGDRKQRRESLGRLCLAQFSQGRKEYPGIGSTSPGFVSARQE